MTSRVQSLRSSTKGARPSGRAVGEIYLNFPDQQIGVVGPSGNIDLLAIRNFSTTADYAVGDLVARGGDIYRAAVVVTAGPWNGTQWTDIVHETDKHHGVTLFDPSKSYLQGELVAQSGNIYRAKSQVPAGPFNAALWDDVTTHGVTPFNASTAYPQDSLVANAGKIYRAKAAVAPGPFTATQWEDINVNTPHGVTPFDAAKPYVANDIVTYQGRIYRCMAPIPAGAWNAGDWEDINNNPAAGGVTQYDGRESYLANALVATGGTIYRAKAAVPVGAWDATKWDAVSRVREELSVDTIADLRALPVVKGSIHVRGYYAAGDGGGGMFHGVVGGTHTDDGGVTLAVTGGAWKRNFSGAVNVKWFGAKGDGAKNDTSAIQAAVNVGSSIFIPDGTYIVSTINIKSNGFSISGESRNAVLKRVALSYMPIILSDGFNDFSASELSIDGNKTASPMVGYTPTGGTAIALQDQGDIVCRNASRATVVSVWFSNSLTSPATFYNMTGSIMERCVSDGHGREGFMLCGGHDCTINLCDVNGPASALPYSAIGTQGIASDTRPHKHLISNNTCYNSQAAILTINTTETVVCNNKIVRESGVSSTGPGIRLGHNLSNRSADKARVFGNMVAGVTGTGSGGIGRGISIEQANDCEIYDNIISNCNTGIGASLTKNTGVVVRDNYVTDCAQIGYEMFNVDGGDLCDNIARNCPTGVRLSAKDFRVTNNTVINAATYGFSVDSASGLNSGHIFDGNRTDAATINKWNIQSPSGHKYVSNEYGASGSSIPVISGANPSAIESNVLVVTNAAAINMTGMSQVVNGAIYTLQFGNSNTTLMHTGGSFRLKGNIDVKPPAGGVMQFLASGGILYELGRGF